MSTQKTFTVERGGATEKPGPIGHGNVNYIKQLNAFWDKAESEGNLKSSAIAIYVALLHINNRCGWKPQFRVAYGQVLSMTGIGSVKTYYSAIKELEAAGYLQWQPGPNQYQTAKFQLAVLYKQEAPENPQTGEQKEAPAQFPQPAQPKQPQPEDLDGLNANEVAYWQDWNNWVDADPLLPDLRGFRYPLTPRDFIKVLHEYGDYDLLKIKCEEIANKVGITKSSHSLLKLLQQYRRTHKELDY